MFASAVFARVVSASSSSSVVWRRLAHSKVHMQVTFEFDLTLYRIDRDVYSILDWVGDLGGLSEGLIIIFGIMITFSQFNSFEHYMIENLYKPPKDKRNSKSPYEDTDDPKERYFDDQRTSWTRQKF